MTEYEARFPGPDYICVVADAYLPSISAPMMAIARW